MDSPLSMDSSTELCPSRTTPSMGILPPGLTSRRSPTLMARMEVIFSSPSASRLATRGCSSIRRLVAEHAIQIAPDQDDEDQVGNRIEIHFTDLAADDGDVERIEIGDGETDRD